MTDEEVASANAEYCAKLIRVTCDICCDTVGYGEGGTRLLCRKCYMEWRGDR